MLDGRSLALDEGDRHGSNIRVEFVVPEQKFRAQIWPGVGGKVAIDQEVCDSSPNTRKSSETVVADVEAFELELENEMSRLHFFKCQTPFVVLGKLTLSKFGREQSLLSLSWDG